MKKERWKEKGSRKRSEWKRRVEGGETEKGSTRNYWSHVIPAADRASVHFPVWSVVLLSLCPFSSAHLLLLLETVTGPPCTPSVYRIASPSLCHLQQECPVPAAHTVEHSVTCIVWKNVQFCKQTNTLLVLSYLIHYNKRSTLLVDWKYQNFHI